MTLKYLNGFHNTHCTEAQVGAVPDFQNSPQKTPYGLYAEQLSGSAFTAPRNENFKSWLYKIQPSVVHGLFTKKEGMELRSGLETDNTVNPNQMRWDPPQEPLAAIKFLESLQTVIVNGCPETQMGCAVHLYAFNQKMEKEFFFSSDGEWLFIPQKGKILAKTEFGNLEVSPHEILIIPRGIKFQLQNIDPICKGYVCENFGASLRLPELGPIGANGLANPFHFLAPQAAFEDTKGNFELIQKINGQLWSAEILRSPLDVVGWRGNYFPYKYNLDLFNTINTVSFDHPDPSLFTVLTSPSGTPGVANLDFVIFPPRWMVAEKTFRPPYFHRNCMSEYMGLITGSYDAKNEGFLPGGGSLHNNMSAHGPDKDTFEKASNENLQPHKIENTLAFMLESRHTFKVTPWSQNSGLLQPNYQKCWSALAKK